MTKELTVVHEQEVLGQEFKVYGTKEEPFFLVKDVAVWLEMDSSNASRLVKNLDEDEYITARHNMTSATFVTEDGLYEVLMQSRKSIAKAFKKEVKQVLKDIRKHGMYATQSTIESILENPEFGIQLLTSYKEEKEKRMLAEREAQRKQALLEQQAPKVAFAERCEASDSVILVRELAKVISNDHNYKIGQNKLYEVLREWGLIVKNGTEPTQQAVNRELFKVEQKVIYNGNREIITRTTKVTGKGQVYIINRLIKEVA